MDLSRLTITQLLRLRGHATAELQVTSRHATPLLYEALVKRREAADAELANRAPAPGGRVALRSGYDQDETLDSQLEDLDPRHGGPYGY